MKEHLYEVDLQFKKKLFQTFLAKPLDKETIIKYNKLNETKGYKKQAPAYREFFTVV